MQARETDFHSLMNTACQYVVPQYQRRYSWEERHAKRLFDDIIAAAKNKQARDYFLGSVLYVSRQSFAGNDVAKLMLIDGQQRITSLSILLIALCEHIGADVKGELDCERIRNHFLVNRYAKPESKSKLALGAQDKELYEALLFGDEEAREKAAPAPRIMKNYLLYKKLIEECGESAETIYSGIMKLLVVAIAIQRSYDDPQLIFESLNSTGLVLSQGDRVRNFMLMQLDIEEQERVYKDVWLPMERVLSGNPDGFFRLYLAVKTGKLPSTSGMYDTFRRYFYDNNQNAAETATEMSVLANRYARLKPAEAATETDEALMRLATLRFEGVYPFLLRAVAALDTGEITSDEFHDAVLAAEAYTGRRYACALASKYATAALATLPVKDSREALKNLTGESRFPTDEEFLEAAEAIKANKSSKTFTKLEKAFGGADKMWLR